MCEVEFWEVFLRKVRGFLEWFTLRPLVDCRIAELITYLVLSIKYFGSFPKYVIRYTKYDKYYSFLKFSLL